MLEYKDIEYAELLTRLAYGEIEADGYRFNVGDFVVVFHNACGTVCIAGVCFTESELRKRLLELSEEFEGIGGVGWDIYRVVMSTTKNSVGLREYSRNDLIEYLDWLYWENCEDHFDIDAIERVATIEVDGKRYWSLTDEQLETVFELFHDATREVTTSQVMYMLSTGELSDLGSGYVPLRGDSLVVGKVWNNVQRHYTYWIERDYFGMTDDENREIDALVLKGYKLWFVS